MKDFGTARKRLNQYLKGAANKAHADHWQSPTCLDLDNTSVQAHATAGDFAGGKETSTHKQAPCARSQ